MKLTVHVCQAECTLRLKRCWRPKPTWRAHHVLTCPCDIIGAEDHRRRRRRERTAADGNCQDRAAVSVAGVSGGRRQGREALGLHEECNGQRAVREGAHRYLLQVWKYTGRRKLSVKVWVYCDSANRGMQMPLCRTCLRVV